MRTALIAAALGALSVACASPSGFVDERTVPFVDRALPTPAEQAPWGVSFGAHVFDAPGGTRLPYRLRSPEAAAPAPQGHPLVVVLHGSGAMGDDNTSQLGIFVRSWAMPHIAPEVPAYVLAPQVAVRSADYAPGADGLLASRPGASLPAVLALVDEIVRTRPVDRSRVYVVGFSMGGSAALNALLLRPDRFAAAVVFAGVPPERSLAQRVAKTPVLLVHGTADTDNRIEPARAWAQALAAAGGRPRFVTYEGMDHRVPPDMALGRDWRTWLFQQRR